MKYMNTPLHTVDKCKMS